MRLVHEGERPVGVGRGSGRRASSSGARPATGRVEIAANATLRLVHRRRQEAGRAGAASRVLGGLASPRAALPKDRETGRGEPTPLGDAAEIEPFARRSELQAVLARRRHPAGALLSRKTAREDPRDPRSDRGVARGGAGSERDGQALAAQDQVWIEIGTGSVRRSKAARASTQAAVALSDGTSASDSPPRPSHCSRARMPISSSVSRQSATKAGQNTARRRLPRAANSGRRRSVYGLIQGVRPSRLWKQTVLASSARPSRAASARAVAKHCAR